MMERSFAGVVLAGGQSRRYGSPKAFEKLDGVPFYSRSIRALQPIVSESVLIAHPSLFDRMKEEYEGLVIADDQVVSGLGPLAGIYSAMQKISANHYITVACDMPLMATETLQLLKTVQHYFPEDHCVIPVVGGQIQPLAAIYPISAKDIIYDVLINGRRRVSDLLERLDCVYVNFESEQHKKAFQNVNTIEDFTSLQTKR